MKKLLPLLVLSTNAFAIPKNTSLVTMDGAPVTSPEGKHLLIFWASWCVDCKAHLKGEVPELMKKYKVIPVNVDSNLNRANECIKAENIKVESFQAKEKMGTDSLQKTVKAFAVPHWAVFDGEKLVKSESGFNLVNIKNALGGSL